MPIPYLISCTLFYVFFFFFFSVDNLAMVVKENCEKECLLFILKCKSGQPLDLERGFELGEQVCREVGVNVLGSVSFSKQ